MIEVEIQNFQSIRKTTLKVDGFTGIEGRSNIGKSAIVRAIRCALTGAAGTDFVRHREKCERKVKGHKKCKCYTKVRLECPQWKLVWEKGDSVNCYKFRKGDGPEEVFDSVSRGTPDFLLPDFESVKVGDSPELIQVVGQFSPIFLLNQSGPAVADVLSDVAKLDNINLAMTLVNKDRKEAVSTRKVREKDIQALLRSLEAYEELDSATSRVQGVRFSYQVLGEKRAGVEQLNRFVQTAQECARRVRSLEAATGPELPDGEAFGSRFDTYVFLDEFCSRAFELMRVLKKISKVEQVGLPESQGVEEKYREFGTLVRFQARVEDLEKGMATLLGLDSVELPDHPDNLKETLSRLLRLQTWERFYSVKESAVRVLEEVDTLRLPDGPENLTSSIQKLQQLESWVADVHRIKKGLRGKEAVESPLPSVESLEKKLENITLLEHAVSLESSLRVLEGSYAEAEKGLQEVLGAFEELGVCPTCSQSVEVGRCTAGCHS